MEILKSISLDKAIVILEKEHITNSDLFKLSTFTHRTLADDYDDLTNSELNEIYRLERQNLYRIVNSVAILCGIYGEDALNILMQTHFAKVILSEISDSGYTSELKNKLIFRFFLSFLMANCNEKKLQSPVFEGKIPQKLFKFRQMTAESWLASYLKLFGEASSFIYSKRGAEEAFRYTIINTTYYLNKSQTFKFYPKSSDTNLNDTIFRIFREYIDEVSGNRDILNNGSSIFYKDL